jgi:hypothetical protein
VEIKLWAAGREVDKACEFCLCNFPIGGEPQQESTREGITTIAETTEQSADRSGTAICIGNQPDKTHTILRQPAFKSKMNLAFV